MRGLCIDEPEIGDVDECVVEGSEYAGDTEDELACLGQHSTTFIAIGVLHSPSLTCGPRETFSGAA